MSTQAVTSGAAKNNGGTVRKPGGNSTTGPITVSRTLIDDAVRTTYGAKVSLSSGTAGSSGNLGTYNAVTTFAYPMVAGRYIMKRNTPYINGVASSLLTSGAGDFGHRQNPAVLETTRALGSGYLTSWDYETGAITKGANAGNSESFGNDNAARPTNAIPGELAYKTAAEVPVQDEYKPRTNP